MIENCKIGKGTIIYQKSLVNLYGCKIGENCNIASFVEIGKGVKIGNNCKIGMGAFIPEGVTIEDDVFIAPRVCFTNDKHPKAIGKWKITKTLVKKGASIGANSTIVCGVTIGENAIVGAGTVIRKNVSEKSCVVNKNKMKYLKKKQGLIKLKGETK